jgi:tetratricopeptide (TPR) repeat protein
MNRIKLFGITSALALAFSQSPADDLSRLPPRWQGELAPLAEIDISGAEPLMRQAVTEARTEVADLLAAPAEPDRDTLAAAYGRLGALLLLLDVEARADICFRNAQSLQPTELRWPYYAGYLAAMAGNADQALIYLEAARGIDPDYPTLHLRLGKVHLDLSEPEAARAELEKIADTPGLASAANHYLGQIALMQHDFETAAARYEKALAADPNATAVHYPLAQAYRALGKDDLAREHLAQFQPKDPVATDPLLEQLQAAGKRSLPAFHKGIDAIRQGDYKAAAERFAEGLAIDPDNANARVSYARALYLSGHGDEAGKELTRALAAAPDLVLANFLQGVLLQQQGDTAGAAAAYRHTLELDPKQAGARFYLANLDFAGGRYADAAAGYAEALAIDREVAPARLMELVARYRSGLPETEVASRLAALLAEHPDDPMLAYAQARLLAGARDPAVRRPDDALALASRLVLLHPIPPHQRAMALAQAATGDFTQAAQTQEQALAMAAWMAPPAELDGMRSELAGYRDKKLPGDPWPEGDVFLSPPPFDPVAPFRDYPASIPY